MIRAMAPLLGILAIMLLVGVAIAAPPPAAIGRHVAGGGGGTVTDGDTFILSSTVGEAVAGDLSAPAAVRMGAGFWSGPLPNYLRFLPLTTK